VRAEDRSRLRPQRRSVRPPPSGSLLASTYGAPATVVGLCHAPERPVCWTAPRDCGRGGGDPGLSCLRTAHVAPDRTGGSRHRRSGRTLSLRHQAIAASHSSPAGSADRGPRARLSCQPIYSVSLGGVPQAPRHQAGPVVQLRLKRRSRPCCAGLAGVPSQTRPGWPHRSRVPQFGWTRGSGLHPRAWRLATGRSVYYAGHASPRNLRFLLGLVACWSRTPTGLFATFAVACVAPQRIRRTVRLAGRWLRQPRRSARVRSP